MIPDCKRVFSIATVSLIIYTRNFAFHFLLLLLADISLVGGYNLLRVNRLPKTLIKEVFIFTD